MIDWVQADRESEARTSLCFRAGSLLFKQIQNVFMDYDPILEVDSKEKIDPFQKSPEMFHTFDYDVWGLQ